jgi:hypothetical protein
MNFTSVCSNSNKASTVKPILGNVSKLERLSLTVTTIQIEYLWARPELTRVEPLTRLLSLASINRPVRTWLPVTNTLAYCGTELITAIKCSILQATGPIVLSLLYDKGVLS